MKHRRLLVGSIIAIPIGVILWVVIGPIVALAGITSRYEGWWIFGRTVTEVTATYWVGVVLSIVGLIISIGGIVGIVLAIILEFLDRQQVAPTPSPMPKPPD